MDGKAIGQIIKDAVEVTRHLSSIRSHGNLGMAIIAAAISEHAKAVEKLADAVKGRTDATYLEETYRPDPNGTGAEPGHVEITVT